VGHCGFPGERCAASPAKLHKSCDFVFATAISVVEASAHLVHNVAIREEQSETLDKEIGVEITQGCAKWADGYFRAAKSSLPPACQSSTIELARPLRTRGCASEQAGCVVDLEWQRLSASVGDDMHTAHALQPAMERESRHNLRPASVMQSTLCCRCDQRAQFRRPLVSGTAEILGAMCCRFGVRASGRQPVTARTQQAAQLSRSRDPPPSREAAREENGRG
jgi:hypothetical protein